MGAHSILLCWVGVVALQSSQTCINNGSVRPVNNVGRQTMLLREPFGVQQRVE